MRILIIDDSDYKIKNIQSLLGESSIDCSVRIAKSFQRGVQSLKEFKPDLVLLDMTLPTSERPDGGLEGRMRIFGGREILAEMQFEELKAKVIIVTQFDHFGEPPTSVELRALLQQLKEKFPEHYAGGVYYSNVTSAWREDLGAMIRRIYLETNENTLD